MMAFENNELGDSIQQINDAEINNTIKAEESLFRTRVPRSTTTTRHIIIVFGVFIAALVFAIVYAEKGTISNTPSAQAFSR